MKNLSYPIFLFLLLVLPWPLLAQQTPVTNLVDQPKWEVGADLLWLIDKNTLPKYSLLIRRAISSHGAIRVRGGYDSYTTATTQYDGRDTKAYQIRAGYEYRTRLKANKSLLFYGVDLLYTYDHKFFFDYSHPVTLTGPNGSTSVSNIYLTTATEKGGAFFVGYKYFVLSNLSLSVESTFQVTSWKQDVIQIGVGDFPEHYTNVRVFPITSLTFSIHF